ncbi:hypothetical protein QAD02_022927 [Eretmocerus hayati]|uniref:Uncharacterized protein n=1 Tax=Eretmocerus hayati TaxID=131215 RepID=A0ACC2PW03_9HYME|nr:hypothetical protein QAD02_022927 [Eretmocerus hayati]
MPRDASSTGLIAATTRPIRRPKQKRVELSGPVIPAPFTLRPFAGLYNPYPYGCSVLCNHPADNDAKDVVRKAKDTWASEGKALLLPPLQPSGDPVGQQQESSEHQKHQRQPDDVGPLPEELFRRYTETDSRQPSPEPGHTATTMDALIESSLLSRDLEDSSRHRTTLVLDLRASSHDQQDNNTLSWRSLTLEPLPISSRRSEIAADFSSARRKVPVSARNRSAMVKSISPGRPIPAVEISFQVKKKKVQVTVISSLYSLGISIFPSERGKSQNSHLFFSTQPILEETKQPSVDRTTMSMIRRDMPSSFLPPDVIKELSRELDVEVVEHEFNAKRRYALEEVLRVTGARSASRTSRQGSAQAAPQDVPRLFYRQSARFELLYSLSLVGLKPLDYLGRHVHVSDARKALFGRVFNKYREDESEQQQQQQQQDVLKPRYMLRRHLPDALREVMGRALESSEFDFLERSLGEPNREKFDFRMWCGICAFAERSLPELPRREEDPPPWLERADFEGLERRFNSLSSGVDDRLVAMLRLIRDR